MPYPGWGRPHFQEADPGRKFAWRLKDWAVYSALPEAARSIGMVVPIRQIRYPLIDSLSEVAAPNRRMRSGPVEK